MQGPEVESFDEAADPVQTVLRSQVVQSVLPSRIIVVALPGQCVVIDQEEGPDARQVEARVPIATNLQFIQSARCDQLEANSSSPLLGPLTKLA